MPNLSDAPYSPGPWVLDEQSGAIRDANDALVLKLDLVTEEDVINARLIAASPELLESLSELVRQSEWAYLGDEESVLSARRMARAAICKARTHDHTQEKDPRDFDP